jgi:hypothetical protein
LLSLVVITAMLAPTALVGAAPNEAVSSVSGDRYFPQTGYWIADDTIWDYFIKRGGVRTFGYPASRKFRFRGSDVQFFQRRVIQIRPDGSPGQLNILDRGLLEFNVANGATFPTFDSALVGTAPPPGSANYQAALLGWIKQNVPNVWQGENVNFYDVFLNTVKFEDAYPEGDGDPNWMPGINLEMWGAVTSHPAADPNNGSFIYLRFQRGIMHYDKATGQTQGLLLGDHLKSIITGQNLPGDLAAKARASALYRQYDNTKPNGVARPGLLPGTNLKDAFEKEGETAPASPQPEPEQPAQQQPTPAPTQAPSQAPAATSGLRYGMQAHLYHQPQARIMGLVRGAGFNWLKQQIRWADVEGSQGKFGWGAIDEMVNHANGQGVNLLFSVVTAPRWSRAGLHGVEGPPNNFADFGTFLGKLAARYKGRVKAYEIWNEQNLKREWEGRTINAGDYVELLKVSYQAIKAADPNAIVVSGALTPTGVNDLNIGIDDVVFLTQMYQYQGGVFKQYADAVGSHASGYNNAPDDWVDRNTVNTPGFKGHGSFYLRRIDQLHQVMLNHGDNRQMWITEFHWASAQPPVPAGYEWTTHLSEGQVAEFLVTSIQSMKTQRTWVGAVFVWNLNFRTFLDYHRHETAIFGILNEDWTPRHIYNRLRDMPK